MPDEPTDVDRTLVLAEIARCRKLAAEAEKADDPASALYAGGIADLLELASIADAAKFVREKALRALTGRAGVDIPGVLGWDVPDARWLETWWLTHRTRKAREALNRERVKLGQPPIIRDLMARADGG